MTTLEQAARKALEALELLYSVKSNEVWCDTATQAITALREALSQPEPHTDHPLRHYDRTCPACNAEQQEPVAYIQRRMVDSYPAPGFETCSKDDFDAIPVYTHPAREWRGLSGDEINAILQQSPVHAAYDALYKLVSNVAAKLKEKNT